MAGDPLYTLLLLGLGLTTFSMNGPDIPEVKKVIRMTTYDHAKQVARRVDELRQRTSGHALFARGDSPDRTRGILSRSCWFPSC